MTFILSEEGWHFSVNLSVFLIQGGWLLHCRYLQQCSIFPFFFFRLALEQSIWESCSNLQQTKVPSLSISSHISCTFCWQNTPRCKPSLQVISDFTVHSLLNGSQRSTWSEFGPFWLFYFLLMNSLSLFFLLFPYRLIIEKNSFVYQSHPHISLHLREATALSSLNLSSKNIKQREVQNSPVTVWM